MLKDQESVEILQGVEALCQNLISLEEQRDESIKNLGKILNKELEQGLNTLNLSAVSSSIEKYISVQNTKRDLSSQVIEKLSLLGPSMRNRQTVERDFLNYRIKDYIGDLTESILKENNLLAGKALEIGATKKSAFLNDRLPDLNYQLMNLTKRKFDFSSRIVVGDITNCPQIPDNSFDFISSISVFEHIDKPWLAAREIMRILRPGGVTLHVAPFSYFYHEAPVDFWRYSPAGFAYLFDGMKIIHNELYSRNRRRDNQGSGHNKVDRYGGSQFSVDGFGGWRENWHTIYAGKKF